MYFHCVVQNSHAKTSRSAFGNINIACMGTEHYYVTRIVQTGGNGAYNPFVNRLRSMICIPDPYVLNKSNTPS